MKQFLPLLLAFVIYTSQVEAQNDVFMASGGWATVNPVANGFLLLGNTTWARADTAGGIIQATTWHNNSVYYCEDAMLLPDNGSVNVFANSDSSFIVLRLDSNGNKLWAKQYLIPSFEITSLSISLNKKPSGFWITGGIYSDTSTEYGFIMRVDTSGNIDTAMLVQGGSFGYPYVGRMVEGSDGSYYFTINGAFFEQSNHLVVLKTDSLLNIKKCFSYSTELNDYAGGKILLDGKNIYIASNGPILYDVNFYKPNPAILEIDTSLNVISSMLFQTNYTGQFNGMCLTKDSGVIAVGSITKSQGGGNYEFVAKMNRFGYNWSHIFTSGSDNDVARTNMGYIIAGSHLIKTDTNGNIPCNDTPIIMATSSINGSRTEYLNFLPLTVISSLSNITVQLTTITTTYNCFDRLTDVNEVKGESAELKVYPNPSNGMFTVSLADSYQLKANSQIEIYNMLGEKIANSQWPIANSQVQIDLRNQPAGVYLYRLIDAQSNLIKAGKLIIEH